MANVKLSQRELEIVTDPDFILTKNQVIAKVYTLFGELSEYYQTQAASCLPDEVKVLSPKISKGENYEGLPWVMLDYPRYFSADHVFAIRTYFWWGHFFSITLQLKGKYQQKIQITNLKSAMPDWLLCCNEDEWQHHFRADNYKPITAFTNEAIQQLQFIKLAKKIPLDQWDDVDIFLKENVTRIINQL